MSLICALILAWGTSAIVVLGMYLKFDYDERREEKLAKERRIRWREFDEVEYKD